VLSRAGRDLSPTRRWPHVWLFAAALPFTRSNLLPPPRYSETSISYRRTLVQIGPVMTALHAKLDPCWEKPRRKQAQGGVTFIYRFSSEIPPVTPLRLKVEINTREHFSVYGFVRQQFEVSSPWFSGGAELVTYGLEELLGTKLRALYQRKEGRDLYDLATALTRAPHLDANGRSCASYST